MVSNNPSHTENNLTLGGLTRVYEIAESGTVGSGNIGVVGKLSLKNGQSIEVFRAGLLLADGQPAPQGLDLVLLTEDNAGAAVVEDTIVTGDGFTVLDRETGELASYTNTTGSDETISIGVDNGNFNSGTGSGQDIFAEFMGRIEE